MKPAHLQALDAVDIIAQSDAMPHFGHARTLCSKTQSI